MIELRLNHEELGDGCGPGMGEGARRVGSRAPLTTHGRLGVLDELGKGQCVGAQRRGFVT